MELIFLGSGTSQGVPIIGCDCDICISSNSKDKRLRSSVLIKNNEDIFSIDAGPDFRQQMLINKVKKLDAVLVTHGHKDHIGGLDDVRAFNYIMQKPMTIWADKDAIDNIHRDFHYAFAENTYPGVPKFNIKPISKEKFIIGNTEIIPIPLLHYKLEVKGFRINNLTYITDANVIPKESWKLIEGTEVLIINALRKEKHISHFNLDEALEVISIIKPKKAYLTHISHLMGLHDEVELTLPDNVEIAYDGLKIEL